MTVFPDSVMSQLMSGKLSQGISLPQCTFFLPNLQVVGVMGQAMQAVSPSLISSILRCAKRTDIPLSNQKAAIQAFRMMEINDEVQYLHTNTFITYCRCSVMITM